MPTTTIPLLGVPNQRNINASTILASGKDQRFLNCFFEQAQNSIESSSSVYVCKRPGLKSLVSTGVAAVGQAISDDGNVTAFGATASTIIYGGTTNCGSLETGDYVGAIRKVFIANEFYYMIQGTNTGYFIPVSALAFSTTFTGDTHTNTTIDNISSLNGLYIGQLITGTGIQAGTRIATITAPSTITTTIATTATNATVTITRTHLAKIIDADFPADLAEPGGFIEMDGYLFIMASDSNGQKYIYNSDLNSVTSWTAQNKIPVSMKPDSAIGLLRNKNRLMAFSVSGIEFFFNAGNSSGSILARDTSSFINFGSAGSGGQGVAYFRGAFIEMGETIVWKGGGLGPYPGIWSFNGGSPQKISSQSIDKILFQGTTTGAVNCIFDMLTMDGVTLLHALFPSSAPAFFYDFNNNIWFEDGFPAGTRFANNTYAVNSQNTTGKIYNIDTTNPVYTDDSVAFTMTIQTDQKAFNNGKPFIVDSIGLLADTQSSGSTTLEVSDDDYASFGTVGTYDLTMQQKTLWGGGYFETAAIFRLTDSGNNAWRGQALVVNWRPA